MINFQLHLFNGENISCANQKKKKKKNIVEVRGYINQLFLVLESDYV